jgi:hypothetical protein
MKIPIFSFQFSDDGAPETSQLTMSIGSRSREFQYLLHCVSLGEKHAMLELLWRQHTDEMQLLESSVFTVCGKECTGEFQPSADMSWQSWACNELNQAATHPCPYANVLKNNMRILGGTIGLNRNDTWTSYTNNLHAEHAKKVNVFISSLATNIKSSTSHEKMLAFMAENGVRQLGTPRMGVFAERVPDPLHCEINAWQHLSPSRRCFAPCEGTNSPRLFTPGETKALAKSKVHQISRASVTNGVEWVVILTDLKNMADCL